MHARTAWAAALALAASPASAEVVASSAAGFVIRQSADVSASPEEVWSELLKPAGWWNGKHSYSGNAANLSIDPRAGGCFCEVLPSAVSPRAAPRGSVEHMRVVNIEQPRALRLVGGLGPLQSEAVQGTLTIELKPIDGGTRILWEYVIGGYLRQRTELIAPAVDAVLGEQISRLAVKLGPKPTRAPATTPKPAGPPKPDASQPGR
jgi:uncharacterized protein YndB with AHSA1/START domain